MKFDYSTKLPKWLNEKTVTILSICIDFMIMACIGFEVYDESSDLFLMMILCFYVIDDFTDNYNKLKELKDK